MHRYHPNILLQQSNTLCLPIWLTSLPNIFVLYISLDLIIFPFIMPFLAISCILATCCDITSLDDLRSILSKAFLITSVYPLWLPWCLAIALTPLLAFLKSRICRWQQHQYHIQFLSKQDGLPIPSV